MCGQFYPVNICDVFSSKCCSYVLRDVSWVLSHLVLCKPGSYLFVHQDSAYAAALFALRRRQNILLKLAQKKLKCIGTKATLFCIMFCCCSLSQKLCLFLQAVPLWTASQLFFQYSEPHLTLFFNCSVTCFNGNSLMINEL